jgi:4-amino-4-deoxy-L-arabinose transferase-like glycosyltransferase
VLLGIAAVAALLYAYNITSTGLAPFYSVAVKSMSESWKAFFYGAFDPQATITIDKLAGSFLPQALSARIFGYSAWSLALPQVIEGVISVLVMYRVVRRWAGVLPGLLAASVFTVTPIVASMFGHSMEDGGLTMCLVLAADSYQRAVMTARLRSLIWAGVWVGLGFQAKMMQAWMIVPALAIAYLLAAPADLARRVWHVGVAGVVMLAVSLSWIALFALTPASDRPYVDGSTSNSAVATVFGYNGFDRFGINIAGSLPPDSPGSSQSPSAPAGTPPPADGPLPASGPSPAGPAGTSHDSPGGRGFELTSNPGGWTKLVTSRFGSQVGWLYPLALLALVAGLAWRGSASRTDHVRAGLVMWSLWLLTYVVIFSKVSNLPHTAYLASLAPPVAALSGAGIVLFWRWYQAGDWRWWVAPLAVAAELGWADYIWHAYPGFLPWARWTAIAVGLAGIIALVLARVSRRARARIAVAGLVAGFAAVLAGPTAYAASVLDVQYAGTSIDASAGPQGGPLRGTGPAGSADQAYTTGGSVSLQPGQARTSDIPPRGLTGSTGLSVGEQRLYAYLTAHRDGATYLMAVQFWRQGADYIVATGQEVLALGGFSGAVPEPTLSRVRQLAGDGQLRFFLLGAGAGGLPVAGSEQQQVVSWVRASCTLVPAKAYGGTGDGSDLYECPAHA